MATIKSFSDLQQSNKLEQILPLESADMYYSKHDTIHANTLYGSCDNQDFNIREYFPCWSLAALLDVLPILEKKGYQKAKPRLLYDVTINKWIVDSHVYTTDAYDNPIDACVAMIIKLNELDLL